MEKKLLLLCIFAMVSTYSFAQIETTDKGNINYFDENYQPISKKRFDLSRVNRNMLSIEGDSLHHRVLTLREVHGKLQNKRFLDSILVTANKSIDTTKTLVIIYYPGMDDCNSNPLHRVSKRKIKSSFNRLEKKLFKITQAKAIYIYREDEGLEEYYGVMPWIKDPNRIFERLFFNKRYTCDNFVVISKTGNFLAYFDNFFQKDIFEAARYIEGLSD